MSISEPRAELRRIFISLSARSDPLQGAGDEAGGQPSLSINGAAPITAGVGPLVRINAGTGLYYSELAASVVAARRPKDRLLLSYQSATAAPMDVMAVMEPLESLWEGSLAAGSTTTATLPAESGASAADDAYADQVLYVYVGPGAGQMAEIGDYVGATRVATLKDAFSVALTAASQVMILPAPRAQDPATLVFGAVATVQQPVTAGTVTDKGGYSLTDETHTRIQQNAGTVELTPQDVDDIAAGVGNAIGGQLAAIPNDTALAVSGELAAQFTALPGETVTALEGVGTLLTRLAADVTTARAAALDNLDAAVSSRGTATVTAGEIVAALEGAGTLLARLAADVSPARAAALDNVDVAVSSRGTSSLLAADVVTAMDAAGTALARLAADVTTARAAKLDQLDVAVSSVGNALTAGDVVAALEGAGTLLTRLATDLTTARVGNLDRLDVAVSTVASDLTAGDVVASMQATGTLLTRLATDLTTARAAALDNLDAPVTTRGTSSLVGADVSAAVAARFTALDTAVAGVGGQVDAAVLDNFTAVLGSLTALTAQVTAGVALTPDERTAIVARWLADPDVELSLANVNSYRIIPNPITGRLETWNKAKSGVLATYDELRDVDGDLIGLEKT